MFSWNSDARLRGWKQRKALSRLWAAAAFTGTQMVNTMPDSDAVVLLSGGIDSSVLLHLIRKDTARVAALCIRYGQRHAKELECARRQAEAANVAALTVLDLSELGSFLKNASTLIQNGAPVPRLEDIPDSMRGQPPTYVPNRNMMLLAIAAAYAESLGATTVYYGAQAQDEYGYWDCTAAFLKNMNDALALNRKKRITVEAPLLHNSKAENVRLGLDLGVDFSNTWSCYRGDPTACGVCPTCVERLKAFETIGRKDPVPYAHMVEKDD